MVSSSDTLRNPMCFRKCNTQRGSTQSLRKCLKCPVVPHEETTETTFHGAEAKTMPPNRPERMDDTRGTFDELAMTVVWSLDLARRSHGLGVTRGVEGREPHGVW